MRIEHNFLAPQVLGQLLLDFGETVWPRCPDNGKVRPRSERLGNCVQAVG
jgi:hypothetical protein